MVLAVAHPNPWESASSYLSSQSLANSRWNLHATSRSSHSRRSLSCRFFLCRVPVALLCFILRRRRRLPLSGTRKFFSAACTFVSASASQSRAQCCEGSKFFSAVRSSASARQSRAQCCR